MRMYRQSSRAFWYVAKEIEGTRIPLLFNYSISIPFVSLAVNHETCP
jgi:hypothetical protein